MTPRSWRLENRLLVPTGLLAACALLVFGLSARVYGDLMSTQRAKSRTLEVLEQVALAERGVERDATSPPCALGVGSPLAPGEPSQELARLKKLVEDDDTQRRQIGDLGAAWAALRRDIGAPTAAACHGAPVTAAQAAALAVRVAERRDGAQRILQALRDAEQAKLAQRQAHADVAGDRMAVLLTVAAGATLLLGVIGLWRLRHAARQLSHSHDLLQQEAQRRNQSDQALQDAQARVARVLEAIPDGVITFDERGMIESCNSAAHAIFGCDAVRLLGQPVVDLIPEFDRLRRESTDATDDLAVTCRRIDAQRLDSSTFPLEITWRALSHGGRRLHLCVLRDLGEQHRVERMKRDFVSVVSHELRTPLTSIRGALALMADGTTGPLPEDAQAMVVMASRNCERLVELVNDILDLDKMQTGQLLIEPEVHDLVKLLRDTLRSTLGFARLYKVRLLMPRHEGPVWVSVDARRMVQVMGNLLSNAIKFSPEGSEVVVRLQVTTTQCTICVLDHGPGIPPEFRAHLFEPFTQADATDTRARDGSGLGLSITRSLVERMDGSIGFECPQGGGTIFRVGLPVTVAPPPRPDFAPTGFDDLRI